MLDGPGELSLLPKELLLANHCIVLCANEGLAPPIVFPFPSTTSVVLALAFVAAAGDRPSSLRRSLSGGPSDADLCNKNEPRRLEKPLNVSAFTRCSHSPPPPPAFLSFVALTVFTLTGSECGLVPRVGRPEVEVGVRVRVCSREPRSMEFVIRAIGECRSGETLRVKSIVIH